MSTPDQQQLHRLVLQRLQSLSSAGVLDLPRARPLPPCQVVAGATAAGGEGTGVSDASQPTHASKEESVSRQGSSSSKGQSSGQSHGGVDTAAAAAAEKPLPCKQRVAALAVLCGEVAACTRCQELATTRTHTVFGVGDPMARLAFLGEAPGADEDRQGEPFVGRAGQLLTKIIESCSLRREDVYILNILKCRPPGNRNPLPEESTNCREHLRKQLGLIRPEFICCLGAVAAQNLLETTTPIGQLRGKFHRLGDIKVLATYHPAYLLRNPSAKRSTWDDMKLLMKEMGIEIPKTPKAKGQRLKGRC